MLGRESGSIWQQAALQQVVETDLAPEVRGASVRKEAAAAIAGLQKRERGRRPE
jgi:hypothetical protein